MTTETLNQTIKDKTEDVTVIKALNSRPWQVAVVISVLAMFAIYWPTFGWWWKKWMEEESYYSHAVLIPFMSAFVIYINRRTIADSPAKPSLWGLVLLVPGIIMQLLSSMANTASMIGMTLPIVILGTVMLLFGVRTARHFVFPVLFLFFMCVLPGFLLTKLSFKIQLLSTTVATALMNLMHFDAVQSGTNIALPNIKVEVGAPCSGFRMLISLGAFAVFFSYMKEGPLWGRLALVALTVPLSLISNSVRVAMIALCGQFFGEDAMHTFHDYSGFIVLIVAFVILWWLAKVVKCEKFRSMLLQ